MSAWWLHRTGFLEEVTYHRDSVGASYEGLLDYGMVRVREYDQVLQIEGAGAPPNRNQRHVLLELASHHKGIVSVDWHGMGASINTADWEPDDSEFMERQLQLLWSRIESTQIA